MDGLDKYLPLLLLVPSIVVEFAVIGREKGFVCVLGMDKALKANEKSLKTFLLLRGEKIGRSCGKRSSNSVDERERERGETLGLLMMPATWVGGQSKVL